MQLNFFNYKIIKFWDKYKAEGKTPEIAAYLIASLFMHEHTCLVEIFAKYLENELAEIFVGIDYMEYPLTIRNTAKEQFTNARDQLICALLPCWKSLKVLEPVRKEYDWLKDKENVKKFIEYLEFLRNCETITVTESQ